MFTVCVGSAVVPKLLVPLPSEVRVIVAVPLLAPAVPVFIRLTRRSVLLLDCGASRLPKLPPTVGDSNGKNEEQKEIPNGGVLREILTGLRYAVSRRDLLGSYLADLAAMILAYPVALFPFLAVTLHAPWSVGLMFAAPSAGALGASAVSGWTSRVHRHGLAIALAAAGWGAAITAFGFAPDLAAAGIRLSFCTPGELGL